MRRCSLSDPNWFDPSSVFDGSRTGLGKIGLGSKLIPLALKTVRSASRNGPVSLVTICGRQSTLLCAGLGSWLIFDQ